MARPDVLRIDDVLFRAGSMLGLLWLLAASITLAIALQGGPGATPSLGRVVAYGILLATAPLGLLWAALRLRRREHRALALLRLVEAQVEIASADLLRDSDLTPRTLERAIRDLNNAGIAFLVWDREAGLVQDGRLRRARVHVDECGACGAKLGMSVPLASARETRCPYCSDPVGSERLLEERARLVDELDGEGAASTTRSDQAARSFSIPIFLVLSLVFWPLGLGYALWHWQAAASRP
jgi:DNA-directed RNA polymerase subunit RPC12/RpoP